MTGTSEVSLYTAVRGNNISQVKHWIDQGADVNKLTDGDFGPIRPLSEASRQGYTEVVKLLLHGGADMEAADKRCFADVPRCKRGTALMEACCCRHKETAEILLAHGANIDAPRDYQHWGALGLVWELASGGTSADEDLGWLKEWWSIVDMLLAAGADVSGKDSKIQARQRIVHQQLFGTTGLTPLMCACIRGYTKRITRLLDDGADVGATDDQGWTALVHAVCNNQEAPVLILLDLQGDAEQKRNVAASESELYGRLQHVVIGQDAALKDIAHVLYQHKTGQTPDDRPLVFLFVGPSRCGKSEAAEQISKVLFQQQTDHQLKFNMGSFQLEHEVSKLNGAPSGYQGSSDGELAILATYDRPVVILDEIEKAHPNVLLFFLSLFDRGCYKTGSGKLIVCRSAIFVMTSNVASDLLVQQAQHIRDLSRAARQNFVHQELRPKFLDKGWRPEFWARISHCIPFLPLSSEQQIVGAKHFLKKVAELPFVRDNELTVTWGPTIVRQVANSYRQFPDLGFRAYDTSEVYTAAKHELFQQTQMLNKGCIFLHVESVNDNIVVRDLLGRPPPATRAEVVHKLQSLVSTIKENKEPLVSSIIENEEYTKSSKALTTLCWVVLLLGLVQAMAYFLFQNYAAR